MMLTYSVDYAYERKQREQQIKNMAYDFIDKFNSLFQNVIITYIKYKKYEFEGSEKCNELGDTIEKAIEEMIQTYRSFNVEKEKYIENISNDYFSNYFKNRIKTKLSRNDFNDIVAELFMWSPDVYSDDLNIIKYVSVYPATSHNISNLVPHGSYITIAKFDIRDILSTIGSKYIYTWNNTYCDRIQKYREFYEKVHL